MGETIVKFFGDRDGDNRRSSNSMRVTLNNIE